MKDVDELPTFHLRVIASTPPLVDLQKFSLSKKGNGAVLCSSIDSSTNKIQRADSRAVEEVKQQKNTVVTLMEWPSSVSERPITSTFPPLFKHRHQVTTTRL